MSRAQLTALLTFLLLLVLGAGAYYLFTTDTAQNDPSDTSLESSEETTPAPDQSSSESSAADETSPLFVNERIPGLIVGESTGRARLINAGLEFPQAEFTATEALQFQLTASGFDLALLADESLAIEEGVYPRLRFVMGGRISEVATREFTLTLSDFTPEFYVAGAEGQEASLSTEVQQELLNKLATVGVSLPAVSEDNPSRFPVEVTESVAGGFVIEARPEAKQVFYYESEAGV